MLEKPHNGWSCFSLGEINYNLSFLTDVPTDWLDSAIFGLEKILPFTVHGFCEPGRFLCTASYYNCHIIFENDENKPLGKYDTYYNTVHTSMLDFCTDLYNDINNNLEAWKNWLSESSFKYEKEKHLAEGILDLEIIIRLDRLKKLISKRKQLFDGKHFIF